MSVSSVAMAVANSGGDAVLQSVQVMAAHFVILPLTICAGVAVSGAHFNPVVTACFVMVGKLVSLSSGIHAVMPYQGGIESISWGNTLLAEHLPRTAVYNFKEGLWKRESCCISKFVIMQILLHKHRTSANSETFPGVNVRMQICCPSKMCLCQFRKEGL